MQLVANMMSVVMVLNSCQFCVPILGAGKNVLLSREREKNMFAVSTISIHPPYY